MHLIRSEYDFSISVITEYEILIGSDAAKNVFWKELFESFVILPISSKTIQEASNIYKSLTKQRKLIPLADILIAATAIESGNAIATLNQKHFNRIEGLELVQFEK